MTNSWKKYVGHRELKLPVRTYVQNKSGYFINVLEGQIQKINKSPVPNKGVQNGKNPQTQSELLPLFIFRGGVAKNACA